MKGDLVAIAIAEGDATQLAGLAPKTTLEVLRQRVISSQWMPNYPDFGDAVARKFVEESNPRLGA